MLTFDIDKILKTSRNDQCWCGSGLKFKRCHLDREMQKPISTGELMHHDYSSSKITTCHAPLILQLECSQVIKAHTISKSSGLTNIADSTNHVLGLKINLANFDRNNGKLKLEKIGINNASTFKGFCAEHDKVLFSCFEDQPFIATEEQCIALAYRSVARAIYGQECLLVNATFMRDMDKGSPLEHQIKFQSYINQYELDIKKSINDLSIVKNNIGQGILQETYNPYVSLVIESSTPIPIVVSSLIEPTHDFKGKLIQNFSRLRESHEHLILNAFSSYQKGFVVISWLQEAETIDRFINSLLNTRKENIFSVLIALFLSSSENSYISPNWWDSLNLMQKNKIEYLLSIVADPLVNVPDNILVYDGIQFEGWNVEKIYRA